MGILDLWVAIVVSSVLVFIASSILHMVIPLHKKDYQKMPGEEKVMQLMGSEGLKPGTYMFPCAASMKDAGTPEMLMKFEAGPVGFLTVIPSGAPSMGKNLLQWFLYSLLIGVIAAYLASRTLPPEAAYLQVFRFVGTIAIVGYALGHFHDSIWKGQSWVVTAKFIFGGIIYGLITAGVFGWLWQ